MNTRLSAIALAVASASLLTACGGGSGPSDFPVTIPPPRVTVTAPATATIGLEFTVTWAAQGATSCNAGSLSAATDTTKSVPNTESTIGTKTYSVTCTGNGGSATGTATVIVSGSPVEGAWQGTTDDNRTISGVVMDVDAVSGKNPYWLAYSEANNSPPAGFVAGGSSATATTLSSTNLREFNFAAGRVNASGSLTAPFVAKTSLGPGSFTDTDSLTNPVYPINYAVTSVVTSPNLDYGPATPIIFTANMPGTATFTNTGVLTLLLNGSLKMNASSLGQPGDYTANIVTLGQKIKLNTTTNGAGVYHLTPSSSLVAPLSATDTYMTTTACSDTASDTTFPVCASKPPFYPLNRNYPIFDDMWDGSDPAYYTAQTFNPLGQSTLKINALIDNALAYEFTYTLVPVGSPPTTRTFNLAYSISYETAPSLTAVASTSYTAAYTGIDATMYHTSTPFSISSGGTINGTETTSHCDYSGTIAPHATGNVYDVTALTFTSSGGTCVYASSGAFTGVATLDAATGKTLTLTALNASRNQGFMVVATKP